MCCWRVLEIKVLTDNNAQGALLHAFDGKPSYALQGAQAGFYFSVPPSIVRSPQKQKVGTADCAALHMVLQSVTAGRLRCVEFCIKCQPLGISRRRGIPSYVGSLLLHALGCGCS